MTNRLFVIGVLAVTIAVAISGCRTTTDTTTNANAILNINANANGNANTNANANANRRSANANISREEYERDRESWAEEARQLGRTIGSGVNDGWLWTKTRALLAAEDDLRDSTINVDVDNEVVTLTGSVRTDAQKAMAGRIAQNVDGVKSVKNDLIASAG